MTQFGYETSGSQVVEVFKDVVEGKTFVITGPSDRGIGAETATCLAAGSPTLIVLAGRSLGKIQPVIDRINAINPAVRTKFINLDLSSLASVREAAASINANVEKIDVLINNAAVMACPFSKTVDGIESQFGTNHVGHFLLTNLIMPKILAAGPGARIVNLSSVSHTMADVNLDDYNFEHGAEYHPSVAYGAAKSANILFTLALAKRLKNEQVKAISLHPGSVATNLQTHMTTELAEETMQMIRDKTGLIPAGPFERPKLKTVQQGCSTTLVAALDPSINSGDYLEDCSPAQPEAHVKDKQKAEKLWILSEKLVGQKFDL